MVRACTSGPTEIFTTDSSSMIWDTEQAIWYGMMGVPMKENGAEDFPMEKVKLLIKCRIVSSQRLEA